MGDTTAREDDNPTAQEAVLEAQIQARLRSRVRRVRVVCRDNGIILQGNANSYYAKQLAQHSVMEITHLPILANEIEVS